MYKKIYFIACLLIVVYHAYAETIFKSDVLKIDVDKEKDGSCPPYSMGAYDSKACSYRFFCRDEVCYPVTNNSTNTVEFTGKNGQVETYNIDNWSVDYEAAKRPCDKDSDCFSNKCTKGVCTLNEKAELTQCMDNYNYNYGNEVIHFSYKISMNCGKAAHVKCSEDSECASNNCKDGECNNDNYKPMKESHALLYSLLIIGGLVLVLIICIYLCCRCCRH
ncbi:hypothetical protein PIROE2DRAFT_70044 [Piromyces sp. E2]|nr:hypothetical protein PIROE2DRAFT_70044 [Piromyces sp. E2]|eukprot:OUM57614.1 hypothetical protein PIROE2DRAFT_70044 [Piromyces sp. E2]